MSTTPIARSGASALRLNPGWCAALLLLAGAAANIVYLVDHCPVDLSGDEAHYAEWSRHLDLSYYSKGPLVACIIAAGRALLADWSFRLVGNESLAVRLPAVLLGAATGFGVYVLAAQTLRRRWLAVASVALLAVIPIFSAGAVLMTIDAPLACAWVWSLVCLNRGLRSAGWAAWLILGLLIAAGILAKYTMLLMLPVAGLTILGDAKLRAWLFRPQPYVALLVGLCGVVPILLWNARHGWVSLRHVGGQAGLSGHTGFQPAGIFEYIGGQLAVSGLLWLPIVVIATIAFWRRPQLPDEPHDPAGIRLLLWGTAVPFGVFALFSPITKVQPNWPVLAYFPGLIVAAAWLARALRRGTRPQRRAAKLVIAAGAVFGLGASLLVRHSEWLMPAFAWMARSAPPWELTPAARFDPSARLRGWSQLGGAVGEVLANRRAAGDDPFILTDEYQLASEIAFYCPGHPEVYCAESALGGRESQYDIWPGPVHDPGPFRGRSCIYVGSLHREFETGGPNGGPVFSALEREQTVTHTVRGTPIRIWAIHFSARFNGFDAALWRRGAKY